MTQIKEKIQSSGARVGRALKSSRGKNVLLYLLFLGVSFLFWIMLSLDNEVQRDFDIPVEFVDVPDSITFINQPPRTIAVSVKAKGSQLLQYYFGKTPSLKITMSDGVITDNRFALNRAKLDGRLRDYFGNNVTIMSCRPDSIALSYTTSPGKKIKLKVNADIHPALQYIISGEIKANIDSVTVYSVGDIPRSIKQAETMTIVKSELKDTMRYEVRIKPIPGVRIIPSSVIVTVPIEPLISKKRTIPVEAINVPEGTTLITFPSKIDCNYLVPMSHYNDDLPLKAYVDYTTINPESSKIAVTLSITPPHYHNIGLSPDSVEYIIER